MGLDIGPQTAAAFIAEIERAKTVIWNGPLGLFEIPAFANGTMRVGEALANQTGVISIIGGGDTASALAHAPWANKFTHISTGGGATLEFLEGRELPGVKAQGRSLSREEQKGAQEIDRGELEDASAAGRRARTHPQNPRGDRSRRCDARQGSRRAGCAARYFDSGGGGGAGRLVDSAGRAKHALRGQGRVHRRSVGPDAPRLRRHSRHRRPFRAPAYLS